MLNQVERHKGFMGSVEEYEKADIVLVGAPMEITVSFRPGTSQAPQQVRRVSHGLEEYSVDLDRDLADTKFFDAGDLLLSAGSVGQCLDRLTSVAAEIFAGGKLPFFLGGEHLLSLAVIMEAFKAYPSLAVIHFDAHADLRQEYLGEQLSHATVMRRVAELVGGKNVYQYGIRSGTREEFIYARNHTNIYVHEILNPLLDDVSRLQGRPIYVTMDIDVIDPAYAPGTGTAEPGGCTVREVLQAIHLLGELNVIGFDLVEVNPLYDQSERTLLLAAKLVREAILSFSRSFK